MSECTLWEGKMSIDVRVSILSVDGEMGDEYIIVIIGTNKYSTSHYKRRRDEHNIRWWRGWQGEMCNYI